MIETGRVLRPLEEAEPAIEQLDTYESPAVLTEALRATWHAVDRTLRTLLRSDASAPDRIRLTALSQDLMSADAVMLELRRREFVSLGLAGRVHELRQALERAESGSVRAADADNAREVVRCLIEEVHGVARRAAQQRYASYDRAFRQALGSFAPVTDPAILNVQPNRMDIVRVQQTQTLGQLAQSLGSAVPVDELALINQVSGASASIPAGTMLKVVRKG